MLSFISILFDIIVDIMSGISNSEQKPIRESYKSLCKYPRFSTVEGMDTRFYETSTDACR